MAAPLRVLIVEDSENDADLLLLEIRRGGYEPTCRRVTEAAGMKAALAGAFYACANAPGTAAAQAPLAANRDPLDTAANSKPRVCAISPEWCLPMLYCGP